MLAGFDNFMKESFGAFLFKSLKSLAEWRSPCEVATILWNVCPLLFFLIGRSQALQFMDVTASTAQVWLSARFSKSQVGAAADPPVLRLLPCIIDRQLLCFYSSSWNVIDFIMTEGYWNWRNWVLSGSSETGSLLAGDWKASLCVAELCKEWF